MTRILITGSRFFPEFPGAGNPDLSREENKRLTLKGQGILGEAIAEFMRSRGEWDDEYGMPTGLLAIVHGACPTGADYVAEQWATCSLVPTDPHPAEWRRYGNSAGPRRNAEMVRAGADVVLAFPWPGRVKGTRNCVRTARLANVPVIEVKPRAGVVSR